MPSTVFVKVVGFRDVERHALNTVFRLSLGRLSSYFLWTPEAPSPPHLALVDVDSYEGGIELASPGFNHNLKLICVGERAPATAWRLFSRPLNWPAVVSAMDQLFTGSAGTDIDTDTGLGGAAILPPGVKVSLLMDASRDQRLYLRARLSLAGMVEVDEAQTPEEALDLAKRRRYDLVIVNLDPPSASGWKLIDQLVALEPAIGSVVMSTRQTSWHVQEQADQAGCRGVLEIPFDPNQFLKLLRKI